MSGHFWVILVSSWHDHFKVISWSAHGYLMVISWSFTFSRLALATVLCPTPVPLALSHDDDDEDDVDGDDGDDGGDDS
eukprot:6144677-Lingulodinium_polyedra.AAC.1